MFEQSVASYESSSLGGRGEQQWCTKYGRLVQLDRSIWKCAARIRESVGHVLLMTE